MIWFTGDTHLGHANIIRYSKRPFLHEGDLDKDGQWVSREIAKLRCDEMDETLIANWNEKVGKGDTVYHLGDFSFAKKVRDESVRRYFDRLNGSIHLIYGNHDDVRTLKEIPFAWQGERKRVKVEGQRIILDHYAGRTWNGSHKGTWQLYGHSHGSLPDDLNARAFDVGIDCHGYRPISFDEVSKIMEQHTFVSVDHHEER